jgi:hypothetical protein
MTEIRGSEDESEESEEDNCDVIVVKDKVCGICKLEEEKGIKISGIRFELEDENGVAGESHF